jgi:hypothetical protein
VSKVADYRHDRWLRQQYRTVSASGYLQGGFWDGNPEREAYGTRIRETTMGALHNHVINVNTTPLALVEITA